MEQVRACPIKGCRSRSFVFGKNKSRYTSAENLAMETGRNRLTPWYVGIFIVLAAVIFIGYEMYATGCATDTPISLALLVVIPAVYLGLMYLTLSSQE